MILRLIVACVLASGALLAAVVNAAAPAIPYQSAAGEISAATFADISARVGQGDAGAQATLGQMYYRGEGVPKDFARAFKWTQRAAVQRHAGAQLALALMYARGDGVRRDPANAFVWAKKAAENGDATAQRVIGTMYDTGNGVRRDPGRAFRWYQKSAAQGDPDAQFNVGTMFYSGEGVRQDKVLAYAWFILVAGRESPEKRAEAEQRDSIEQALTAGEIAEARRISAAWLPGQTLVREVRDAELTANRFIKPVLLLDYELREH